MTEQPAGTVTLLFTDIEGSTRLLDDLGADRYRNALGEHRQLLRTAFERHGGYEVDYEGDAFFVAFASAAGGLAAAEEAQAALAAGPIRVRMGLHTGEPLLDPPKYVGIDVHRAARIMSAGHGGQVLVSETTAGLVGGEFPLRDLGPHRLKDLTAAERLFQLGDSDFPPLKSLRQTNLPVQATPLVGREREVSELVEYLRAPDTPVLTLTGVGGTGKTRLALQSAAELSEDFRDGVWFVDLAPLRDPGLVEPTIAMALGADDLVEHLRSKETLLVLDNFEQVVDAAGVVSGVVSGSPATRLLVTSRVALRIAGERLYPVSPLSREEAVELFTERAHRVKPGLALNGVVGDICDRLDRLPLAIELAAARVRVLAPPAMLARLEQRLPLLTGGARDLPTRQQTLEGAIAWSYELLEPEQQRLFAELAVFNGGRTLDAIEAVCNPDGDIDALAGVETLVDASLLNQDASEDGEVRFVMLETIHEYARTRLDQLSEAEEVRRRHALFFLALVESAGPKLFGVDDTASRSRLDAEKDNLRGALDWLAGHEEPELELRMAGQLDSFWAGGLQIEGVRRLEHALARAPSEPTKSLRKALVAMGNRRFEAGDYPASRELSERALDIARTLDDDELIAASLSSLALDLMLLGENAAARALFEESATVAEAVGDFESVGIARANLAWMAITHGDYDEARRLLEGLVQADRKAGSTYHLAMNLCNLGWAHQLLGDSSANECFRESLGILRQVSTRDAAESITGLAAVAVRERREQDAARLLGLADAIMSQHEVQVEPFVRGLIAQSDAATRAALGEEEFKRLYAEGAAMDPEDAIDRLVAADR